MVHQEQQEELDSLDINEAILFVVNIIVKGPDKKVITTR